MDASKDVRVIAIRDDSRLGRGTCSHIDECFDDSDLVDDLDRAGVHAAKDAVAWAREWEGERRSYATNYSSGDVDCHLLAAEKEWQQWMEEDANHE